MTPDEFRELLGRARVRDQKACAKIVHHFTPAMHRQIRTQLAGLGVSHALDTEDVCQTVLANLFVRLAAGQFQLDEPDQLSKLLNRLVRNQVIDDMRHLRAARRGASRQQVSGDDVFDRIAADQPTPSRIVGGHDLLAEMYRRLTAEERSLADLRRAGREWDEIGREVGASPDSLRKKLARAYDRVIRELQLDEPARC